MSIINNQLKKFKKNCLQSIEGFYTSASNSSIKIFIVIFSKLKNQVYLEREILLIIQTDMSIYKYQMERPNPHIAQQLHILITDFHTFPQDSFQRAVQRQLINAYSKKYEIELPNSLQYRSQKKSFDELKSLYQRKIGPIPSDINFILSNLKSSSDLYDSLSALKKKILIINTLELERLIDKTKESEKSIEGKDAVLFVGNTGSGKSTTILKFLGYELKKGKYNSINTLVPTRQLEPQHQSFHTSPQAKSCTRYINAVPFPKRLYPSDIDEDQKTLVICDSPGFGDSAGAQVDIANGVGMINALRKSKSVRIVLILPYHSITADRLAGTLNISSIICNLLAHKGDFNSVEILFNMVPQNQIENLPLLIESKIANLNTEEKGSKGLQQFLQHIYQKSNDKSNYYDPLQANQEAIFKKIISMNPIIQVQDSFRYEFSFKTKKQIERYYKNQQGKIKDSIYKQNLKEAHYHLKMLLKMKTILPTDNKISQSYNQAAKCIQDYSDKLFFFYQQFVKSVLSSHQFVQSKKDELKTNFNKIQLISSLFHGFEKLSVVSKEKIQKITNEIQKILLNKCFDIDKITQDTINSVNIFSEIFKNKLKDKVVGNLQKKYKQYISNLKSLCKQKKYVQMKQIQIIKKLYKINTYIIMIFGTNTLQTSGDKLNKLKQTVKDYANEAFNFIKKRMNQQPLYLNEKIIEQINTKIQHINAIASMKFTSNYKQIEANLNKQISAIIQKCKSYIKDLQQIKPYSNQNQLTLQKQKLQEKKNLIDCLMNIPNVSKDLSQYYKRTLENIKRKSEKNIQTLEKFLNSLKKSQSIYLRLQSINKSINAVIQYQKIIDSKFNIDKIIDPIKQSFINYLQGQQRQVKRLDVNKMQDLQQYYHKIEAYAKLKILGGKDVDQALKYIRDRLIDKLKSPFSQFKSSWHSSMKGKPFKNIIYVLDNLQVLSNFSFKIQLMLSIEDYNKISSEQEDIKKQLTLFSSQIKTEVQKFIHSQDQKPDQIKNLIRTLVTISTKIDFVKYLRSYANFDVFSQINRINTKFKAIEQELRDKFQKTQKTVHGLQLILKECNFHLQNQGLMKKQQKILSKLQKECQQQIQRLLKSDEEKITEELTDKKPTKIEFQYLKAEHEKFGKLNSKEGKQKTSLIEKGLKQIEEKYLKNFEEIEGQIGTDPQRGSQLLEIYPQLATLQENLTKFYKKIVIDNLILKKAYMHILNYYVYKFKEMKKALEYYNMVNYNQLLKKFRNLQLNLYKLFQIQKQLNLVKQQKQQTGRPIQKFARFLQQLKQQIRNKKNIRKNNLDKIFSLKQLIIIIQEWLESQIRQRYLTSKIQIDKNYRVVYEGASNQDKLQMKRNLDDHLAVKFSSYLKERNFSSQNANIKRQQIQKILHLLPKDVAKENFDKIQNLQKQNQEKIKEQIKKQVGQFSPESDRFFKAAKALLEKGQKELYQRYVSEFAKIYASSEKGLKTVDQKLNFVQLYFIKLCQTQHKQLSSHKQMYEIYLNQFQRWHQTILKNSCIQIFDMLNLFFKEPLTRQNLQNDYEQISKELFQIYNYIISLSDLPFINIRQLKNRFCDQFRTRLKVCIQTCNSFIQNKEQSSLISQKFTIENKNSIQNYTKGLKQIGKIMDFMKIESNRVKKHEQKHKIKPFLQQELNSVKDYQVKLKNFKNIICELKFYLKKYTFYDDNKRNMSPNEIQQDLSKLNNFFRSFKQREQLFENMFQQRQFPKQAHFSFKTLENQIQAKFNSYVEEAQKQFKVYFNQIETDPITKINLLKAQLMIMKQKQLSFIFIKKQIINKAINQIKNLIDTSFKMAESEIKRQIEKIKPIFVEMNATLTKLNNQQKKMLDQIKNKYQKIFQQSSSKQKQRTKVALAAQNDEMKIKDIKNNELAELNNIKKDVEERKSKQIEAIRTKFLQESYKIKSVQDLSKKFCKNLIIFQKALIDIIDVSQIYKTLFQQILMNLKGISSQLINIVEKNLENSCQDSRCIGKYILLTHKKVFNYGVKKIQDLMKGQDIKYAIQNLQQITIEGRKQISPAQKKPIQDMYRIFKESYDYTKDQYQNKPIQATIVYMVSSLNQLARSINERPSQDNKVRLLAGIFALWVCLKSEQIETGEVKFTIEPHPTQITTLLLLLGIAQKEEGLSNRLAQVGTGEGKSIVLAGLCSYLALLGYDVRCACYSLYLSTRDESNFRELFLRLGVEKKVRYGTFNELCEDVLNSGGQSLKEEVEKMILSENEFSKASKNFKQKFAALKGKSEGNQTILVIDEVDVFFEESFFGKSYCPAISLKGEEVEQLIKHVWKEVKEKGQKADQRQIIKSKPFINLTKQYPALAQLLSNQINGMIAGAINYKHEYFTIDKRIGYKDGDEISYSINFGYKTVFANLYEYEKGSVSQLNLANSLQISLMFAQFSYAQLPSYFRSILGVTGTLQVLPKYKKRLLVDRYGIREQYAIPSAFGINKKRVQRYTIRPQQQYQEAIVEKIAEVKDRRPIIVFFKGPKELNEFFNCSAYEPFKGRTYSLTERHDAANRDSRILTAVNPNNITLMSSAFGRGTDFVLLDDKINDLGGLHVIQAFLSLEESEEVQIKGRTARQNSKGSYDCVISSSWLQQLDMSQGQILGQTSDTIYQRLFSAREKKIQQLSSNTLKALQNTDRRHKSIFEIFLQSKSVQRDLVNYVAKINQYPSLKDVKIKTILALDATGSMSQALQKTCLIIGKAFQRTYSVLQQKKVEAAIQVKIMIYRNYNSLENILQSTAFQSTPINLNKFLEKVRAQGGMGNEALEILFQSLNKEDKISQVILIGDAPANTPKQVIQRRIEFKGQEYWVQKGFPLTNINQQLQIFKSKNCPVHSFYLNNGEGFQQISKKTKGQSLRFEIDKPNATQKLAQFIIQNILNKIQEKTGKKDLIQLYRKMYMKK